MTLKFNASLLNSQRIASCAFSDNSFMRPKLPHFAALRQEELFSGGSRVFTSGVRCRHSVVSLNLAGSCNIRNG